ncbi:uncharacterized protein LOC133787939 isoform X1 [Humulus lupulus]|uniref:uncharacterized protein LOC133787939 isoform X1 n=1 Tax=Humulus lupulus TaxID=3486 RepID=UPI002B40A81E|nr:uncharacterized protein LOC133787939 isoform X1 [Humulus lupulus]XP_062081567.1 uncharacterized protein LOC133787939 isoform X1 [Humulus lupulus]
MDFDEYEYLENTVENPEPRKAKETVNGGDEVVKSSEKDRSRSSKHRSDDKDDDRERRSRRSKSGEDSRDHGRHKEKGSSRHRSRSKDGDRERHKSSGDRREREDRDKEKSKDKDREERNGRERGERRERDREGGDRERDRDKERSRRSQSQSQSHSERHRSGGAEREQSHDKELREREKEREVVRERDRENRESRRYKDKKEEQAEPEVDPERDQRTVFAYQICLKADERDVYEFFSRAGKVRDVRLIMDRNSRRSKGVGYIEFYDVMSVPMAIALSGQPLLGQPVMVKPSEAEKNLVQSTAAIAAGAGGLIGPYSGGARRLYVGNLHTSIKEEDLRQVFGAFGPVELVQLPLDETGLCKGFGFVQFGRLEDARNALSLNGQLEIGGRTLKVSAVTDQVGMQELGGNTGDFDDDEGSGLALNAHSRALLMQKLDRSGTSTSMTGTPAVNTPGFTLPGPPIMGAPTMMTSLAVPLAPIPALGLGGGGLQVPTVTVPAIDTIGVPSECLLLKNMFDPTAETEPNFDLDIKEDVQEECSKFGNLKHIFVDKNSVGFVYLRFEHTQSAVAAQRALHGRWFAGKMITASYMLPQNYEDKFPESR